MKDFKTYSREGGEPAPDGKGGGSAPDKQEMYKILQRAMSGKSEARIWRSVLNEAERGKRAGTLKNSDLDEFYGSISPFLDAPRRKKLKEVIARLKAIEP